MFEKIIFFLTICVLSVTYSNCACNGPFEEFTCGSYCDTTCATLGQPCPIINVKCTDRCRCKRGYARNTKNICIPEKTCLSLCIGPFEEFSCGSFCDTTCATLGQPCPIVNVKCTDRCRCRKGHARNTRNICIPEKSCPKKTPKILKCGVNEEFKDCKNLCPDSCSSLPGGKPGPVCSFWDPCIPGCDCKPGFYRNNENVCVTEDSCPCDDPFSFRVLCPYPCPPTCADFTGTPKPCDKTKRPSSGCVCVKKYIIGPEGKCIKIEQCPCGDNEEFTFCVPDVPETCADRKSSGTCSRFGCICQAGFIRRDLEGPCIAVEDCPECSQTTSEAYYTDHDC